jgi:hypothetical protein
MGQRFQIAVILPKVFMNKDNPNNRGKKVLIFHDQWLYGYTALEFNLKILNRLKYIIDNKSKYSEVYNTKKGFINFALESVVLNSIQWVKIDDPFNTKNYHSPTENDFKGYANLGVLLSKQDNNNGFFIIEIKEDLSLNYAFINGLEDSKTIKLRSPKEYLNLFYSDEDLFKNNDDKNQIKEIKGFIKGFDDFDHIPITYIDECSNKLQEEYKKYD